MENDIPNTGMAGAARGLPPRDAGNLPFVLTPSDIREFQRLIQEHCGVSLTETEAWNRATELVALYRMLIGPIPEDPAVSGSPTRAQRGLGGRSPIGSQNA